MRDFCEALWTLYGDDNFLDWQNEVTQSLYEALGQGYSTGDNEVGLVERLVDTANGQSYGPMRISASMLHGSRSYVEFRYMDKPTTKELGDMAIVSLVTRNGARLLQRMMVIQNKKARGESWSIDQEQLFLLKNFPTLTGNKGVLRRCGDLSFWNRSGCLGAFGLLREPGEMLLASAFLVSELMYGKKSLSSDKLAVLDQVFSSFDRGMYSPLGLPLWIGDPEMLLDVIHHLHHRLERIWGYPFTALCPEFPRNVMFTRDLHDFTRAWTLFSLGEFTCVDTRVVNPKADGFANLLLRKAKLAEDVDLPRDEFFSEADFGGQMAVLAAHFRIEG